MKNNLLKIIIITIITIITIIIIIIIIIIRTFYNNYYEKFDNSHGLLFQTGISDIEPTGTITFAQPYLNPPKVFTQIIGNTNSLSNTYSIQIFNITNTNFNYSKNSVAKDTSSNYNILKIQPSIIEPFNWIAIG